VIAAVDVEAVAEFLKTLAELILAPSPKRASATEERKQHIEKGLCFKCHRTGNRPFQSSELKGKEAMGAPSKKQ
jgi:hypothetical protein